MGIPEAAEADERGPASWLRAYAIDACKDVAEQFWQAPHRFTPIAEPLIQLVERSAVSTISSSLDAVVQSALVALAAATSAQDQHKVINNGLLKRLRHDDPRVRLAAVKVQRKLGEKMGEEWLGLLPETLPFVAEILEDDDEHIEREGRRWVRELEEGLGESIEF